MYQSYKKVKNSELRSEKSEKTASDFKFLNALYTRNRKRNASVKAKGENWERGERRFQLVQTL